MLQRHVCSSTAAARYAVMIPTWNNLGFLQLCVRSLREHAGAPLQIVVFVNDGSDGTREWLAEQTDIDYILADENRGICYALNMLRSMARAPYLVYLNDDMYVLPGWDKRLLEVADALDPLAFMLSATMIEPYDTGNPCVRFADYGQSIAAFREEELLDSYRGLHKDDWSGSTWPPNFIHVDLWDAVGGMSVEFSPGIYSDPDLSRKLWHFGVRDFRGVGDSLVYHFGRQSTGRLKGHTGREKFLAKWGTSAKTFMRYSLRLGERYGGPLGETADVPTGRKVKDWAKARGLIKA